VCIYFFEPLFFRINPLSTNPVQPEGQCVKEVKSSQQTSPCPNNLSNLSVTFRVLMSIWTCERKLHHSPSKKEMLGSSEGNLHFVCIKRWEYIWTHQTTILGPITHTHTPTHTLSLSLSLSGNSSYQLLGPSKWVDSYEWTLCWQFILVGQQMQGWQMFLSFSAITLRTAAWDEWMLEKSESVWLLNFQCTWLSRVLT